MVRRRFLSITTIAPGLAYHAMAQGPAVPAEAEAGKVLLGILIPAALEELKKWLQEKPKKDVAKDALENLYNSLGSLRQNRPLYVTAVKEYLADLRADGHDPAKRRAAQDGAKFMLNSLSALDRAVAQLGVGFEVVAPDVKRAIATYGGAQGPGVSQVASLEKMTPEQRRTFERQLDENSKLLSDALESLRSFIAANYKLEDLMK